MVETGYMGFWGGGLYPPIREGFGKGLYPLRKFPTFLDKIGHSGAFLCTF